MDLSNLRPAEGSKHSDNFRRGRGHGSGNGKTAGKGHKGQLARSGHKKPGFEGGQMPLQRRLPKFGFKNVNRKEFRGVNLDTIQTLIENKSITGDITKEVLVENGIVSKNELVKIMGRGELKSAVSISADKFTKSAEELIAKAGGKAITL